MARAGLDAPKPKLTMLGGGRQPPSSSRARICAALEREFREVADGMGGGPSVASAPRHGHRAWSERPQSIRMRSRPVSDGRSSTETAEPRLRPSRRNVGPGRRAPCVGIQLGLEPPAFRDRSVGPCEVSLTRWVHPGGRDHDVYRVRSSATCRPT